MKTSFKLVLMAVIILFGTTAAYDIALLKEYSKNDYKKPYLDYDQLSFRGFDSIEIVASNLISVEIVKGNTFDVKKHKWLKKAKIEQRGKRLVITFNTNEDNYYGGYTSRALIIQCPILKEVKADARFILNGKPVISRQGELEHFKGGQILIKGFKQDEFSLVINNASIVYLKGNDFGHLKANIGSQDSSRSVMDLDKSNKVLSADINLQHSSIMSLKDIYIDEFKYKLSDSAQVNLSGISLRLLSN